MAELGRNLGLLALRLMAGAGIAALHGYVKVFGGGHVWIAQDAAKLGLPVPPEVLGWASSLTEFLGGILIAVGLGTRPMALLLLVNMTVAAFMHHAPDALTAGSGKELALAYWAAALTLTLTGGGSFALDRFFTFKKKGK